MLVLCNSLSADLCTLITVLVVRGWPSDKTVSRLLEAGSGCSKHRHPANIGE